MRTKRLLKKLDYQHTKYIVIEKLRLHVYQLDVKGIHDTFYTLLLQPAAENLFLSQVTTNYQLLGVLVDGEMEYLVEQIEGERVQKRGHGQSHEYLVKQVSYDDRSQVHKHQLEDAEALDVWEASKKKGGVML